MWKIGNRLNSAAARLLGTTVDTRADAIREARHSTARHNTTRHGTAWSAARMLGAALLGCSVLLPGCTTDDDTRAGIPNKAAVQLSVGASAVSQTDGTPTEAESELYTLRVYAFVDGKPVGHYFTDEVTMTDDKTHTFYMDLAFTANLQKVDFYVVANEAAMNPAGAITLNDKTAEQGLKNFSFNNQLRGNLETNGLPMFCEKSVDLDFTNLKGTSAPAGSGHEGHALLSQSVTFELRRPMAKLGVFAAKAAGETGTLQVTGLTMMAAGTQRRNYLMTPTQTQLESVESGAMDIAIEAVGEAVATELAADAPEADRKNPANYTAVMAEPFYPFENPWSNGGGWSTPGNGKEHVLKIDYEFTGAADGQPRKRTGYVYLPAVSRNQYVMICCLMHNEGRMVVEYSIEEWADESYTIEFNYPVYDNPLTPASGAGDDKTQYPQPTIWCNSDPASEEGSYTFMFNITGPEGQKWNPVLGGVEGTTDKYEVSVYRLEGGERKYITEQADMVAHPDSYYIRVRALDKENIDKTVGLGIAYAREWSQEGSNLLLINGLTHNLRWEGSEVAEYVVLKQIDVPAGQNTDEP